MCSGVALWWLFGLASLPSTFPHIPLVPDAAPCLWGPEILAAQALFGRHGEFEPFPLMLCFGMLSSKPPLVLPWGVCGTLSTHARPSWSDPHVSVRCTVGQVPGPCPCCPCLPLLMAGQGKPGKGHCPWGGQWTVLWRSGWCSQSFGKGSCAGPFKDVKLLQRGRNTLFSSRGRQDIKWALVAESQVKHREK